MIRSTIVIFVFIDEDLRVNYARHGWMNNGVISGDYISILKMEFLNRSYLGFFGVQRFLKSFRGCRRKIEAFIVKFTNLSSSSSMGLQFW